MKKLAVLGFFFLSGCITIPLQNNFNMIIGCEEVYENGEVKIDCDEHIFKIKKVF